jgi:hypothetical protein
MAIEDRSLKAGTKLVARYKGQEHTAEVVETEEGLRYRLEDGREFKSPSSAGSAIMGGSACNGWRFWSVAGTEAAKPKAAKRAAKKNGNPGNGLITRLEDGRWFCNACMEAFDAPAGVEPQGCPQGHPPEAS